MHKPNMVLNWSTKKEKVTVEQAIWDLPSLEAG